jgi:hypothetical protein
VLDSLIWALNPCKAETVSDPAATSETFELNVPVEAVASVAIAESTKTDTKDWLAATVSDAVAAEAKLVTKTCEALMTSYEVTDSVTLATKSAIEMTVSVAVADSATADPNS